VTYLITLICILIALTLFVGAFYLSKYVVDTKYHLSKLEIDYKLAVEHIGKQEEHINQLAQTIEYMENESKAATARTERNRTWNPSDPLSSGVRM